MGVPILGSGTFERGLLVATAGVLIAANGSFQASRSDLCQRFRRSDKESRVVGDIRNDHRNPLDRKGLACRPVPQRR